MPRGRQPTGEYALSDAERQARYRARRQAEQAPQLVRYRRPIWYAAPIVAAPVSYAVARPVAGPCTCLSKQYTQEGAVVFKDNCTNEMAMNQPASQQTGMAGPQPQPQGQPQAAYTPQYPPQTR